jgi:hypothetical protein
MTHALVKRGPKDWYCTVCTQSWTIPSKAWCPDMIVIAYADRGPLMSQTELYKRGYKTSFLPPSTCCYRMNTANNDVLYVKLYDPALCTLRPVKKHKVLHYIDVLHWPKAWGPLLDTIQQWDDEHKRGEHARVWRAMCLEMGRMVSPLLTFAPDEIAAFAGDTIEFKFPLIPVRSEWADRDASFKMAQDLVELLLKNHRNWIWRNRPPLTEAELEEQRLKTEERNRRGLQIVNQELQERFCLPDWVTIDADLPPAVQKTMFDDTEVP